MKTRADNDQLTMGIGQKPSHGFRKAACEPVAVVVGLATYIAENCSNLTSKRTRLTRALLLHSAAGYSSRRFRSPGTRSLRNQMETIRATLAASLVFSAQMLVAGNSLAQNLPAHLPSVLTQETAAQVGAVGHIWLPRTDTKPYRPALALPDGSYIEGSIETTIFKGDLEVEGGVYKGSCEPATHSIARVSKSGTVLWAKSYFVRGKLITMCHRSFYGFEVRSGFYSSDASGMYLMPDKHHFLIFLGSYKKSSPFVLLDVEAGMPSTPVPPDIRIVDAKEVLSIKKKLVDDAFTRYRIPKGKDDYLFPAAIPALYKELEKQVFRKPAHTLQAVKDQDRAMR